MTDLNIFLAFGAGLLSFVSPCVLPLYPAFLSYITGMSVSELQDQNKGLGKRSLIHTVMFLLGFSAIFIVLGFGTTLVAEFFLVNQHLIRQIGAILIVFFGLVIIGVLNFDFLSKSKQVTIKNRPAGFFGSFIIGMAFSMGWTPCTGPILMGVIMLAGTHPDQAMILMISYVLGFAIPFLLLAFFVGRFDWIKRHSERIMRVGGYIMIIFGVALFFDWMTPLTSILAEWTNFKGF
ncbi:MAG TPA: cytochrome c biogenesis protein CcdA [Pseudogracilibacillus sp.]|nr:cytochrome c biogenesis protein CcdA [Pseudogracilibacillus sp.]